MIQKLVHKVKIKPDGLEIEYFVGERYFERELVGNPTGSRSLFLLKNKASDVTAGAPNKIASKLLNKGCSNNFDIWCAEGDLNPHAEAHAPQTCVSTNSTIRAIFRILKKGNEKSRFS